MVLLISNVPSFKKQGKDLEVGITQSKGTVLWSSDNDKKNPLKKTDINFIILKCHILGNPGSKEQADEVIPLVFQGW